MIIPLLRRTGFKPSKVKWKLLSLRSLPFLAKRILVCCNASFAMSAMNFCEAIDIKRILK